MTSPVSNLIHAWYLKLPGELETADGAVLSRYVNIADVERLIEELEEVSP